MHYQRLHRPNDDMIRTTVRSIESYRDRCIEVRTSSVDGSAITLSIFVEGKLCLKKSVTSSNEARILERGMKLGRILIDALDAERRPMTARPARGPFHADGDAATDVRTSF